MDDLSVSNSKVGARSTMSDDELIAKQARKIEVLKDDLATYREAMDKIYMLLYCIGGPLNDNREGYTKAQLGTFFDISRHVIQDHE